MDATDCSADCVCRHAVLNAYWALTSGRCSDRRALSTCVRLYRCHHRDAAPGEAWAQVSQWINSAAGGEDFSA
jgi:hypothetical protein